MSKCYWKNHADRPAQGSVATNVQFVKNAVPAQSTVKWDLPVHWALENRFYKLWIHNILR